MRHKEGASLQQAETVAIHSKEWCCHILRIEPTCASRRIQLLPPPPRWGSVR